MKMRMNSTTPSARSGVAPSTSAICGANANMSTETATIKYADSQKPCENALRAPSASPAPRRLPATVATPMPKAPPRARFSSSSGMMMPTTARPNDPRPFPMITPSKMTMTAWAAIPMSVMSEYLTNSPCTGLVESSRLSSDATVATASSAISAALLSRSWTALRPASAKRQPHALSGRSAPLGSPWQLRAACLLLAKRHAPPCSARRLVPSPLAKRPAPFPLGATLRATGKGWEV